jgi:FdhD protein
MMTFDEVPITRISGGKGENRLDTVVAEVPLTLIVDGQDIATIICTPEFQQELVVGFLFSERRIESYGDVISLDLDEGRGVARVATKTGTEGDSVPAANRIITPGCFFYTSYVEGFENVESGLSVTSGQILALMSSALKRSALYRKTGGVHSAALCTPECVLVFREDIGRHNAVDKVIGHCLLEGMPMSDHILLTSGRISSALLAKLLNARIPVVASSSAPTTEGVHLAQRFGVTLVGFARGKRVNVYAGEHRMRDADPHPPD